MEDVQYKTQLISKINNRFISNPVLFTLVLSILCSLLVGFIIRDYGGSGSQVQISNPSTDNTKYKGSNIEVDISGAVNHPGVYILKEGSRLVDLIDLSGGYTSEVSSIWVSKNLNMSQNIIDGQKVYIPFEWDILYMGGGDKINALTLGVIEDSNQSRLLSEKMRSIQVLGYDEKGDTSKESTSSTGTLGTDTDEEVTRVNINTASVSDLDTLPGIGPAYAQRIIEGRPYTSFEEFMEASKLPSSLAENIQNLITY